MSAVIMKNILVLAKVQMSSKYLSIALLSQRILTLAITLRV